MVLRRIRLSHGKLFLNNTGQNDLLNLGLLLLIVFLLYLPPVQNFLLPKAERYA